ncbi:L,D-transpeptidase [Cryptosporangium arvum]|uniref:L,D-transpeptidase n=1 Tax=Cryptosporangium arvum TaxID=80871 RepID=UPI0004B659F1|nr:Ig-like domain-containing protein [Cryptosporangium arvum]
MTPPVLPGAGPRGVRGRLILLVALLATALLVAGCSGSGSGDGGSGSGNGADPTTSPSPDGPKLTVKPAADATAVPPTDPITLSIDKDTITAVSVKSDKGDAVEGEVGADKRSWASKGKLSFGATYTVSVTTTGGGAPLTSKFATVPTPGADSSVRASSPLGDNKSYGVGMPIVLKLSRSVKSDAARTAYEKMLKVSSEPPTTGAWGWVSSTELHFRPSEYWAAGSKVHVTVDSAGRPVADGVWGRTDMTIDFKIGTNRRLVADSSTHTMKVSEGGEVVRSMPISLGKPKYPSSSGTMVVIDKRREAMFDSSTYGLAVDSPDGYRTKVEYPMRLTWGGEFIHSAPWSVEQQGKENVSHGCINVSEANAIWLYERLQVGDPVTVKNTETTVELGNGYSDWTLDFEDWLTHSKTGAVTTT